MKRPDDDDPKWNVLIVDIYLQSQMPINFVVDGAIWPYILMYKNFAPLMQLSKHISIITNALKSIHDSVSVSSTLNNNNGEKCQPKQK